MSKSTALAIVAANKPDHGVPCGVREVFGTVLGTRLATAEAADWRGLATLCQAGADTAAVAWRVVHKTIIAGVMFIQPTEPGAVVARLIGPPTAPTVSVTIDGRQYTAEDLEEAAAAAELATITLTSETLESIAARHQPPAEWYHSQEEKPF